MTNHWNDLKHADVLMIIGANPAENHPISFRWILKALEKGGKLISVDPRFTRTSQMANVYGQLRSGTDIPFIGGMINYILENELYHKEYVAAYTNAAYIIEDTYSFEDGMFSGYDKDKRSYDKTKWAFKKDEEGKTLQDPTLKDPNCVFQLMKKHFSRYDIDTVIGVTGTAKETYLDICKTYASTGEVGKAGTILYAMGGTQHTVGTQNIRSYAILQLLLGNIGIQGGGVNALRGESNVQGSTDFGLLYDNVPGYMQVPTTAETDFTYQGFLDRITPKEGYWVNKPKFYTSMLKSFYGDNATKGNDFGYDYLPKLSAGRNYSFMRLFDAMYRKELEGLLLFGSNPAVGGPNAGKEIESLSNLKWMVAVDLFETETSSFWQKEAGADPASIQTEVIFLPASSSFEKEGSVTNSGRWMQYRWQAIKPKGESKADLEIVHMLARKLKDMYKNSSNPADMPMKAMTWDYGESDHPDIDLVCREINGYDMKTKQQVKIFGDLKDDGSTCSGNWIYCGFYPENENLAKRRDSTDEGMSNFLNWSFAWPANRRILYNRASADLNGKAWSKDRVGIEWNALEGKWKGHDVPDFVVTKGPDDPTFIDPFIMMAGGKGAIFASINEGPLPEHYEPYENPMKNSFSSVQLNPAVQFGEEEMNAQGDVSKYPIVATTYRLSEHWQSGAMTRSQEWLAELVPHMFVEISEELASEKGIKNKDKIVVSSARGEIEAYAMVTKRFKPYKLKEKTVHHIGMPWHFGYKGIVTGGSANRLTPHIGDANSTIPEYKAFLCDVRRAK
ncbi:formate dehydrogenase major subunit [Cytobacillus eiseniae]|uniref:Formate dehydrogenase major subunit n=3 Tax=Cytobacillus eiseniae TaxID=762947 RepID=A0ABS4RN42_9BACI|nr:formate dehydrogenase major subunit [Cytobacillus eiseniae]